MNRLCFFCFALLALESISGTGANNGSFRAAVNIVPPFTILKSSIPNARYCYVAKQNLTGMEVELFDLIAHSFKMTIQYHVFFQDNGMDYGSIANGNITGMFHDLQQGKFDVLIGNMRYTRNIRKYFVIVNPWLRDEILYCVSKKYVNGQWMIMIKLLSPGAHALIIFLIMAVMLIFWKQENYDISSALCVALLLICGSPIRMPTRRISRIAISCLICFELIITVSYVSVWICKLSDPDSGYGLFPSTVEDLFKNNLKLYITPNDRNYLALFRRDILKNSQICVNYKQCTEAIRKDTNAYTLLPNILVQYNQDSPLFAKLKCMHGHRWKIQVGLFFILRKNCSLAGKLEHAIQRLRSYGMYQSILNNFVKPPRAARVKIIGTQMRMKHIMPSFYGLFAGYLYGVLVFLGEWVVYLLNKRKEKRVTF